MAGLALAISFLTGVILHDSGAGLLVAVPLLGAGGIVAIMRNRRSERILVIASLALVALGAWRAHSISTSGRVTIAQIKPDRSLIATIVEMPRATSSRTTATISVAGAPDQRIVVSLPPFPAVAEGDVIRFWAPDSWESPAPGTVRLPEATPLFIGRFSIEQTPVSASTRYRAQLDAFMTHSIDRHVPEPAGALALGVLNGDDSGMTAATRDAFRRSGMSQITAVSGWNVALVAGFVALFATRFPLDRRLSLVVSVAVVWAYAFLVGMDPSVLRAAGMTTVFLITRGRGRPRDLVTSLLITVAAIVALTPSIRFDIGFQLSVAATLGVILLLEQSAGWPEWGVALALPFAAQIAVMPLLLHQLGQYSLVSPLANFVIAPLVSIVMFGGVATLVASLIHPVLADIAGLFTWVPARLIVAVAERSASFGWASGTTITLSWSDTFLSYLSLLSAYLLWANRRVFARVWHGAEVVADEI